MICPVIDIRLKCGTASFNEAVKFVFKEVNHAAFQRRLNKYINQINLPIKVKSKFRAKKFLLVEKFRHDEKTESESFF